MAQKKKKKFWLVNPPSKRRRRRPASVRKRSRPSSKTGGSSMARRRVRRRRTVAKAAPKRRRNRRRRNPPAVARANPPRRRRRRRASTAVAVRRRRSPSRRRYRRNPSFSVRGILRTAQSAAMTAVQIVGGKTATRVVRNYIPGGKPTPGQPLTMTQIGIELGAATLVGYLASMFLGERIGANVMAGGFSGVVESLAKTYKIPVVADALGDDGDPNIINVPASMAGYVREVIGPATNGRSLAGYPHGDAINGPGLGEPYGSSGFVNDGSGVFEEIGV